VALTFHELACLAEDFRLAERDAGRETPGNNTDRNDPLMTVQVRMPDLRQFDQLLSPGEQAYG